MLCRALIAAVALIYLMCVLLLSGMQKEDLDVSMLTKLQQHNVNISDMNNEELLQACIQSRRKNKKVLNVSGIQSMSKSNNDITNSFNTEAAFEIPEIYPRNTEQDALYNTSTVYKPVSEPVFFSNENKASPINIQNDKSNIDKEIQYTNGQPKLQSVLKFWQDMGINNAVKISEPIQKPILTEEQATNRRLTDNKQITETDAVSRLLANFLSQGSNIRIKPTTTQKSVHFGDMYEKLSLRIRDAEKDMPNINLKPYSYLPIYQTARKMAPIEREDVTEKEPKIETEKHNTPKKTNLTDVLNFFNSFQNYNPLPTDANIDKVNRNPEENSNLSRNPYINRLQISEQVHTTNSRDINHGVPRDMIKEIADSVKEIILKDLRKELQKTETLTTSSTTTIHSTTKSESIAETNVKKGKGHDSVMNKFLELFEEIKSLKQNAMIITSENNTEIIQKTNNKIFKSHPQVILPTITSKSIVQPKFPLFDDNQDYRIKQYQTVNSNKKFNFAPQLHKFRSNRSFIKQETNKGLLPITVQTNNIEIPPLGIPLDKPQGLINQNIVVTTTIPYRITAKKNRNLQRGGQHIDTSKTFETYKSKQVYPRLSKEPYGYPIHHFHSNPKDDVIRFTLNNNERSKYNADYYEKINLGKYKPHSDSAAYEDIHQEIPRFHEKLENVGRYLDVPEQYKGVDKTDCCNDRYGYSKAMIDCCNRKIASRQQMSLNNMKKNAYDDTHFKNFLQSQQKVTDMLERILAVKGNVQSVETA